MRTEIMDMNLRGLSILNIDKRQLGIIKLLLLFTVNALSSRLRPEELHSLDKPELALFQKRPRRDNVEQERKRIMKLVSAIDCGYLRL